MKRVFLLFTIGLICHLGVRSQSLEHFIIDLDEAKAEKRLSDLLEVQEVIQLDFSPKNPVEWIEEVHEVNGELFLLDGFFGKKIHRYGRDGGYLGKVGKIGEGPGGFTIPFDIAVGPSGKNLYVLDGEQLRINRYDLASGKFSKSFKIPTPAIAFSVVSDTKFLLYNPAAELGSYVYSFDLNSDEMKAYLPKANNLALMVDNHFVDLGRDSRFFLGGVNTGQYIYTVDDDVLYPRYKFDFGKYNLTQADLDEGNEEQKANPLARIKDKVGQFYAYAENEKFIVAGVRLSEEQLTILIDKTCGAYNVIKNKKLVDDITFSRDGIFRFYATGIDKDYFYYLVMPGYVDEALLDQYGEDAILPKSFFASFDETRSNPLLVKVKLKLK